MKITAVQAFPLSIPYCRMTPPSPWADGASRHIMIKVLTDEAIIGYGESFALGAPLAVCNVIDDEIKPLLLGQDPTEIELLVNKMHHAMFVWGRRGLGMFALSGVEIALWDIAAKFRGVPVCDLLGGRLVPKVRAYASMLRYSHPEHVAEATSRIVKDGFTAVKLHQVDLESLRAAREAVGSGVDIMLDVNCVWSAQEAIQKWTAFEEFDPYWLEEPVWPPEDYYSLAKVSGSLNTPVAAGENESTLYGFRELVNHGAADILQPSITKVGGLLECKKICELAREAHLAVVPHSFYFGPGLAATLHLIASTPGCPFVELRTEDLVSPVLKNPLQAVGGFVEVPTGPGLGVELNDDALKHFLYQTEAEIPFCIS